MILAKFVLVIETNAVVTFVDPTTSTLRYMIDIPVT